MYVFGAITHTKTRGEYIMKKRCPKTNLCHVHTKISGVGTIKTLWLRRILSCFMYNVYAYKKSVVYTSLKALIEGSACLFCIEKQVMCALLKKLCLRTNLKQTCIEK